MLGTHVEQLSVPLRSWLTAAYEANETTDNHCLFLMHISSEWVIPSFHPSMLLKRPLWCTTCLKEFCKLHPSTPRHKHQCDISDSAVASIRFMIDHSAFLNPSIHVIAALWDLPSYDWTFQVSRISRNVSSDIHEVSAMRMHARPSWLCSLRGIENSWWQHQMRYQHMMSYWERDIYLVTENLHMGPINYIEQKIWRSLWENETNLGRNKHECLFDPFTASSSESTMNRKLQMPLTFWAGFWKCVKLWQILFMKSF